MPSKRHGYLTRKEWLAQRLEDARNRAGAFDVARLLRFAAAWGTWGWPKTFEKPNLDAICTMGFSAIEARVAADLQAKGYSVRVGELTPEDRAQRKSPPIHVWIAGLGPFDGYEASDECANGFLCCNFFPVGDPVDNIQPERCERCDKTREVDCS
jgi:hypothetical protein